MTDDGTHFENRKKRWNFLFSSSTIKEDLYLEGDVKMNQQTLELFKTLTELPGTPGNEHQVRQFVRAELEKYADEVIQDNLGGIFGVKKGPENSPKILVAGHMDEVGFMVSSITDNGMIRFQPLGGWWNQVMLAQRVEIVTREKTIPGVIGSIPPTVKRIRFDCRRY